jgi:hypothetical protein
MLARRQRHACYVGKHYIGTEALPSKLSAGDFDTH